MITTPATIHDIAAQYLEYGLSTLPIRADGSKAPDITEWKTYQSRLPTGDEILRYPAGDGIGIICGAVSGNLQVLDFDDVASYAEWAELVTEYYGVDLFSRLVIVKTPRPGFHVYLRCDRIEGNQKLAQTQVGDGRFPKFKVLVETRGEGGYVLAPGCPAACHETGRSYDLVQGSLLDIPTISPEEREALFSSARALNQVWKHDSAQTTAVPECAGSGMPGSEFCIRATWDEVLLPHGFKPAKINGDVQHWTRPDKAHGVSASTNYKGSDLLYVFSTNCAPFESERTYNKFAAYSLLNHEGDFSAAARELAKKGYGAGIPQALAFGSKENSAPWPILDPAAIHGVAGDIVRALEPYTEADPVAVLGQILIFYGNAVGRNAYFQIESDKHFANEFIALVGDTSKGRKGTSKGQVLNVFGAVDDQWSESSIKSGLSSGEGLIWAVRDAIEDNQPVKEHGRVVDYQIVITDHGVEDKRLLALESEFASVLRVLGRDGNTLSAIIRNAWDDGKLKTLTKNSPATATNAHISIVSHVTVSELRRYLDSTECGNGFANRFIWICVCRSKCLPEGGQVPAGDLRPVIERLIAAVEFGRKPGRIQFDPTAREKWNRVYPELSAGHSGLYGAVTGRAEAHVIRLALIYALLDCSAVIRQEHLEAAIALWEYAEASVRYIFGESTGDPDADAILDGLNRKPDGMTRTEISGIFGRNRNAGQIARALGVLEREKRIVSSTVTTDGLGRKAELWKMIPR